MTQLHLTDEQLSMLLARAIPEAERGLLSSHLESCESCFTAYQDALRYRGIWDTEPSVFRAPDEIHALALRIPGTHGEAIEDTRRTARSWWRTWALPATAVVMGAVAIVAAINLWSGKTNEGVAGYGDSIAPVRTAVVDASAGGSIVIPGAETVVTETSPMFRTGRVDADGAIKGALEKLTQAYRDNDAPAEVAHWLVSGFLATGDLDAARLYVEDARVRYPNDARFLILDGLVAYRTNDMGRAERLLQAALRNDPSNGTAMVNLGLVQYERGNWESARKTFQSVQTKFAGSPLEARATTLLIGLMGG